LFELKVRTHFSLFLFFIFILFLNFLRLQKVEFGFILGNVVFQDFILFFQMGVLLHFVLEKGLHDFETTVLLLRMDVVEILSLDLVFLLLMSTFRFLP
jgi:hypothetical protein